MIVARNGQITSGTGHDHEQRPRCLKVRSRHNGIALRPAAGATRRRRSRPQRGPGQQQSPEIRHHGPLEFLALRRPGPRAHAPQTGTLVLARNDSLRPSILRLRGALAVAMIGNGTPIPVVSAVLGHASSDTTQAYYLRFDTERLRRCALDVEDVLSQAGAGERGA